MTPKLTPEQREAIHRSYGPVRVVDDETHAVYYLVDASTLSTMEKEEDAAAIRDGIADMEAGRVASLEEVDRRIRSDLGFSPNE